MAVTENPRLRFILDARTPMRDGVEISSDVYLPEQPGRYPAVIQRTPYDNINPGMTANGKFFASHGYAFVAQDVRGRGDSDGKWVPWMNEAKDGYDAIEWAASQPWCDGTVGMIGGSYMGYVQWAAARQFPPHLKTLISIASAGRPFQEFIFDNGKMMMYSMVWLNQVAGHTLQDGPRMDWPRTPVDWKEAFNYRPMKDIMDVVVGRSNTVYRDWLKHNRLDDYWKNIWVMDGFDKIDLPALHITGWYDPARMGELYYYDSMRAQSPARDRQFLLVGPWNHGGCVVPVQSLDGVDFSPAAVVDMYPIYLRWFDYWLKGIRNGQEGAPRVRIFTTGRNAWRTEPEWPVPAAVPTAMHLKSHGHANSSLGDGVLSSDAPDADGTDSYTYDPLDPTPITGDLEAFWGSAAFKGAWRPLEHSGVELRKDLLAYTTPVLSQEVEVTGTPYCVLHAASDALDTDFGAVLSDVYPDGHSVYICEGILRASFRESLETPKLLEPGRIYEYKIELLPVSHAFQPGHRIRVSIVSCRFPHWDRNPNTGAPLGEDAEVRPAHQTIYFGPSHPSRLELPVVPHAG